MRQRPRPFRGTLFTSWRLALIAATAVLASLSALIAAAPAQAATQGIPYVINFQGRLTDASGNILADGSYNIKFRLFDAASSGTNLWEADRVYGASDHRISVSNGLFSVRLGDAAAGDPALGPSIFNTSSLRYLEVELPSTGTNTCASNGCASFTEGPFTPRHIIGASPYAYVADTLDGLDSTDLAQVAQSNTFSGANTFSATNTFSKSGGAGIVLSGSAASGGALLQMGSALSSGSASGTYLSSNGAFSGDLINLQVSNSTKLRVDNSGNLTLASGATLTIGSSTGSSLTCTGGDFLQNATITSGLVTGGSCAAAAASGANTTLSNLGTTSINADLLPSANNTRSIGSAALVWSNLFAASLDAGSTTTTLGVGTANASAITVGKAGTTTTFNGPVTLAAGQNLILSAGTGTLSQTFSATTGTAHTLAATNSATGSGTSTVTGQAINLTGTDNTTGTNVTNALLFGNVTAHTNNSYYGLNFGTGYTDLLRYNGTQLISGTGVINSGALSASSLTVTAGTGLTGGGSVSLGGSTSLSVSYGATSGTAVQGNTTLTCASGTGNLTGGGTSITLGSGGTCAGLSTVNNPSFSTSVTSPSFTGAAAVTLSSGGSSDLTLDSASNVLQIAATDTTLSRIAAGTYTIDLKDSSATTLTLDNSGAGAASLNLNDGGLNTAGSTRLTNGGALQNITGFTQTSGTHSITSAATTGNVLSLSDTGFTGNGAHLADFSFTNANASATATTVSGLSITPAGGTNANASANTLNAILFPAVTPVTNNAFYALNFGTGYNDLLRYNGTSVINGSGQINGAQLQSTSVANGALANSSLTVTAGTGLSGGGSVALGSSTSLSVAYGATSTTAVRGDTSLTCTSGTGNLSGGGGSITLGSGGSCGSISISSSPSFTGTVTASNASGVALAVSGTPTASATSSLVQLGGAISGGNAAANGGTYLGMNLPASGAGSAADLVNLQKNNVVQFKVDNSGNGTIAGSLSVGGVAAFSASGLLSNSALDGTASYTNLNKIGTVTTGAWNASAIGAQYGGTGQTSYTTGDLLYASSSTALSKLSDVATGFCLVSGGVGAAPSWGSCAGSTPTLQDTYNADASGVADVVTTATAKTILFKAGATFDSASLFQVQDSSADNLLTVDSETTTDPLKIQVGSGTTDTTLVLLQPDSVSTLTETASCSTTVNQGALYFNTTTSAIRACMSNSNGGSSWEDLMTTAGLGIIAFGVVPDGFTATNPGDLSAIGASGANSSGPCKVYLGSTLKAIRWTACTAYTGGRKVIVAAQATDYTLTTTASSWTNICLLSTNNYQPKETAWGTENNASIYPSFSASSPTLCLASISTGSGQGNITGIYDVRTFTTSVHTFVNVSSSTNMAIGNLLIPSTTNVVAPAASATANIMGVLVAWGGATAGTPNAIATVGGPVWAKATGGTAAAVVIPSATAGRVATGTSVAGPYGDLGLQRSATWSSTCTAGTASTCQTSIFFDFFPR